MKSLESLVPPVEKCRQMKEAGFPQETSCFVWMQFVGQGAVLIPRKEWEFKGKGRKEVIALAAPLLEEVLEQLPDSLNGDGRLYQVANVIGYGVPDRECELGINFAVEATSPADLWLEVQKMKKQGVIGG